MSHSAENDAALLIECDSILSLIRYREARWLSEQSIRDLDALLPRLRARTDALTRVTPPGLDPSEVAP